MNLISYYRLIFNLKQHHQWNIEEIENLIPWEREVYVEMLKQFLEEEAERIKKRNNK